MRLAASILRFFFRVLQLCGSPWHALFTRQRLDTRTLTVPRVRTPSLEPALRMARPFSFKIALGGGPSPWGPLLEREENEMRSPAYGFSSHFPIAAPISTGVKGRD